jgi:3-deoxy-7-phosphoheptulonate synthase
MLVKMRRDATREEVVAVEEKLHGLGFKTGKMVGEEITLVGVYGDISRLPTGEIEELPGVEALIPISRAYKRVAQKGTPEKPIFQSVRIARLVKEAGAHCLRGGVVKYRSSPYSGWEGLGASDTESLKKGLGLLVKAGREFGLPTAVEILDAADVPVYEDAGVDCIQIGEPNSKNQALLNRLRTTPLPVIHKRGNSLDTEAYLLWVERMMTGGKENVILCERGITSPNRFTRNTIDVGSIAAFRYQLSGLPIAVDASHGTGIRDLVHPATLAGIMAGASVVLVEAHPNPLIAKSDGFQGLFPEQLRALVKAAQETWKLRRALDRDYLASAAVEKEYLARMEADRARFFGKK